MGQDESFEKFRREGRRVGNSTRMIDAMVQKLFTDGYCMVTDHYYDSDNMQPSINNFHTLTQRLYNEHEVTKEYLIYNKETRKLILKQSYYDRYK